MRFSIAASIDRFGPRLGAVGALASAAEEIGYGSIWLVPSVEADDPALTTPASWSVDPWSVAGWILSATDRVGVVVCTVGADEGSSDRLLTMSALAAGRCQLAVGIDAPGDAERAERIARRLAGPVDGWSSAPDGAIARMLVSGTVPSALATAGRFAHGWVAEGLDDHRLATSWGIVVDHAIGTGRPVDAVSLYVRLRIRPDQAASSDRLDEVGEELQRLRRRGVSEAVLDVDPRAGLDRMLSVYALLYERVG